MLYNSISPPVTVRQSRRILAIRSTGNRQIREIKRTIPFGVWESLRTQNVKEIFYMQLINASLRIREDFEKTCRL
jgi:hypothetical protein